LLTIVLNGGLLTKKKWIWGEVDKSFGLKQQDVYLNISGSMDQSQISITFLVMVKWIMFPQNNLGHDGHGGLIHRSIPLLVEKNPKQMVALKQGNMI